jgi:hypothetical protein
MISTEVVAMPDILIRGLSTDAVERIDAEAEALGLSRNEYLRRKLEINPPASGATRMSLDDLRRAAAAASDLFDPQVMESAWQ